MRLRFGWFVVLVAAACAGYAQQIPGSVYTSYGFGDIQQRTSAYSRALGNTSIAVRNENNLNATNPAALTAIGAPISSFFEIGSYYGSTYSKTTANSNVSKSGGLAGMNYWFRIAKKWGAMLGVSPVTNLSYNVATPRTLGSGTVILDHSKGAGNINQFYIGAAFDVLKNLSVGLNVSYYLGNLKKSDDVTATSVSNAFEIEKQITANGVNLDYGIQYTLPIKKTKIIFGATYDFGAHLSGHQQVAIVNPITFDTLQKTDKKFLKSKLPSTLGAGIGVKRNRSSLAIDLRKISYTNATFDQPYNYRDSYKLSGGYEFRGDFSSFSYLKTISLRAGAWVQQYPVIIQGAQFNTWGYTFGVALPIQNNRATIALNYSLTQNGVVQSVLVRERFRSLSLDVIFRDVWGGRRKFD